MKIDDKLHEKCALAKNRKITSYHLQVGAILKYNVTIIRYDNFNC